MQQFAGRIDLDREPRLREVDLYLPCAFPETVAPLRLVLAQQISDELLPRITRNRVGRVHQTQRRRRDDRLLHRTMGIPERHIEVTVRIRLIPERSRSQAKHPADMAS